MKQQDVKVIVDLRKKKQSSEQQSKEITKLADVYLRLLQQQGFGA